MPRYHRQLQGATVATEDRSNAVAFALQVIHREAHQPTTAFLDFFCDGSYQPGDKTGGIAVVYRVTPPAGFTIKDSGVWKERAWPLETCYDSNTAEVVSKAESLAMCITHLKDLREAGWNGAVHVTIFNDSRVGLTLLASLPAIPFKRAYFTLLQPVVDLILDQVNIVRSLGENITLEFRWISGHDHPVTPHINADKLSKKVRKSRQQINSGKKECSTMRFLKQAMQDAAFEAAKAIPGLKKRLKILSACSTGAGQPESPNPAAPESENLTSKPKPDDGRKQIDHDDKLQEKEEKEEKEGQQEPEERQRVFVVDISGWTVETTMVVPKRVLPAFYYKTRVFINDGFGTTLIARREKP
ncbi:hypothetical protein QBC44DRAFT_370478 [Cladorrhinum sp. PSN332]|nr:hypothetical protein QBC44DRAFT_370478 [Cladorrhinum sp. PSN332]